MIKEKIMAGLLSLRFFINNNPRLKKSVVKLLDQCPAIESKLRNMWHKDIFKPAFQPPYGKRAEAIYEALAKGKRL